MKTLALVSTVVASLVSGTAMADTFNDYTEINDIRNHTTINDIDCNPCIFAPEEGRMRWTRTRRDHSETHTSSETIEYDAR